MRLGKITALAMLSLCGRASAAIDDVPLPDGTTIKRAAPAGYLPEQACLTVSSYKTYSAAIANGASLSGAIDLESTRFSAVMVDQSAWTAAAITFAVSVDGVSFYPLYDSAGAEVSWTVAAGQFTQNSNFSAWRPFRYLKIRSGTAATPVNQGGARMLTIIGVP